MSRICSCCGAPSQAWRMATLDVEYDADEHWLIENDGAGASQIIARDVPQWFGQMVVGDGTGLRAKARDEIDLHQRQDHECTAPLMHAVIEALAAAPAPAGLNESPAADDEAANQAIVWQALSNVSYATRVAVRLWNRVIVAEAANPAPAGLDVERLPWRHAVTCDWERATGECSCGLTPWRAALDGRREDLP